MSVIKMSDLDLAGKRVLIRQDLNVPLNDKREVTSDARILASLPTIKLALEKGAKQVMIMSHLGRPTEGEYNEEFSLAPVAAYMGDKLGLELPLVKDWVDGFEADAQVVMMENVRFNVGEKKDNEDLSKKMAALCDVYVMDAFGTAHRAQASTHGVGKFATVACAGPLLAGELEALAKAMANPERPMVAIVGGSKVSTKLTVLESLSKVADQLVVGGGIANTFIAATDKNVGKSLCEADLIPTAKKLMDECNIPVATDVVVGKEFSADAEAVTKSAADVEDDDMIFDLGPDSAKELADIIMNAKTVLWNGPVGVFEFDQFGAGTETISKAIAESPAFSVAGGGDTLAAIDKYKIKEKVSYISTGGGAFLEFVEGKTLPAVAMLEARAAE